MGWADFKGDVQTRETEGLFSRVSKMIIPTALVAENRLKATHTGELFVVVQRAAVDRTELTGRPRGSHSFEKGPFAHRIGFLRLSPVLSGCLAD